MSGFGQYVRVALIIIAKSGMFVNHFLAPFGIILHLRRPPLGSGWLNRDSVIESGVNEMRGSVALTAVLFLCRVGSTCVYPLCLPLTGVLLMQLADQAHLMFDACIANTL